MEGRLEGKTALVTGASRGLGRAIALKLADEGARVALNYRTGEAEARRVADAIASRGGTTLLIRADVSVKDDARGMVAKVIDTWGRLDILVNNAGIYEFSPVQDITEEHFRKQFDLNVLGLTLATQAAVKQFNPAGGSIINISSVVSTLGIPAAAVYSGTKGAVDAITRSLAKELGPRKIRVNALNPGMVETEGVRSAGIAESDFRKQVEAQTPLGRIGQPQDIAPAAVFLASSDSAWITGETLLVAGGLR